MDYLLTITPDQDKGSIIQGFVELLEANGYNIAEINSDKPWGGYIRIENSQADMFVEEFFPELSLSEARFGDNTAELSPKILVVAPGQRLSWQYHDRRAERWRFLTSGAYHKSMSDEESEVIYATSGDVVQFSTSERHRLSGLPDRYVVVAEIWQHTDKEFLSDENDIVRLQDDYTR